ncbi:MAG: hypothetical protein LBJ31_10475 [Treponema sp.]|jgi:hypothetical protein|nr:hypothetical protein [Treponema sp.]
MNIREFSVLVQVPVLLLLLPLLLLLFSCRRDDEIIPPETPPLSRAEVGYAVVSASYTKLLDEPDRSGVTLGYVREKTILKILERRLVKDADRGEVWVLVEGEYQGWLPESAVKIYDTGERAKTAAR